MLIVYDFESSWIDLSYDVLLQKVVWVQIENFYKNYLIVIY